VIVREGQRVLLAAAIYPHSPPSAQRSWYAGLLVLGVMAILSSKLESNRVYSFFLRYLSRVIIYTAEA
jgi:hypothetical protein